MQDEPEGGACFQREMSLKGEGGILGIADQQESRRKGTPGADPGIFGSDRRGRIQGQGTGGAVCLGRGGLEGTGVPATVKGE